MCSTGWMKSRLALKNGPLKKTKDPLQLDIEDQTSLADSANGLTDSSGPTGQPSPSESDVPLTASSNTATKAVGVSLVRRHQGHARISTGFLTSCPADQAIFIALREDHGEGAVMVTLSLKLDSVQWRQLERALTMPGASGSVDVSFEPTTPNEAPPTTVEST